MLTRCLFCRANFRRNDYLEHFGAASSIAYDARRGRLWAICQRCGCWTLAPFESRWEAMEELERVVPSFRMSARTENISLHRAERLEIVRIGTTLLREQAWWRYGRRLIHRQLASLSFTLGVGGAVVVAPTIALGLAAPAAFSVVAPYLFALSHLAPAAVKTARFGWTGWRSDLKCLRCKRAFSSLSYYRMAKLRVVPGKRAGDLGVRVACPACRKPGLQLNAAEAELFVHRYLAHRNMFGASGRRIDDAAEQIDVAGSSTAFVSRVLRARTPLTELNKAGIVAFEMALNDESERGLLQLKVAELQARWREAEEIAAIADGELTPGPTSAR